MKNLRRFETINDYNVFNNRETLNPFVSVIDFSRAHPRKPSNMYFGIYAIFLKDVKCGDLRYGKNTYDYQEGTLVFISPGQVVSVENSDEMYQPKGYALVFHPDFIMEQRSAARSRSTHFLATSPMKHSTYLNGRGGLFWSVFQRSNMNSSRPSISTVKG